jgi:hypothetical protein
VSDYELGYRVSVQTGLGPTQPSLLWMLWVLSLTAKRGRGVMMTTHRLLVLMSTKRLHSVQRDHLTFSIFNTNMADDQT